MNKIYGNEEILSSIDTMFSTGRIPHSFLIFGEKGLGKKALAENIASRLVDAPNIHSHPDVIYAEHEGKLGGFKADYVRGLLVDAFITPNNSERKVYVFTDCDNMSSTAQNALLKVVEEPPRFTYFIFTVSSKNLMLQTILSRVVSFGMSECKEDDCLKVLLEKGFSENEARSAIYAFHGNIGMCEAFLSDDKLKERINAVRSVADSVAEWDEYKTLKALYNLEGERSEIKSALYALAKIFRDSSVIRFGGDCIGCHPEGSKLLAEKLSAKKTESVYYLITETLKKLDTNVAVGAELASLCGQIYNL